MVDISSMKKFKKDIKDFSKIAKKEPFKAKSRAVEIIKKCDLLMLEEQIRNNEKWVNELQKAKETLLLFIDNINTLEKIKNKWDKKK